MPGKEWTDDEVQAEIAEAVRIVREDKFEAFVRSKVTPPNNDNPTPPPPNGNPDPPKGKKSLWWGEQE